MLISTSSLCFAVVHSKWIYYYLTLSNLFQSAHIMYGKHNKKPEHSIIILRCTVFFSSVVVHRQRYVHLFASDAHGWWFCVALHWRVVRDSVCFFGLCGDFYFFSLAAGNNKPVQLKRVLLLSLLLLHIKWFYLVSSAVWCLMELTSEWTGGNLTCLMRPCAFVICVHFLFL